MSKSKINIKELLSTDVHFGHSSRKWCAHMSPYIYMKQNGIYLIDLYKTIEKLQEACKAIQDIVYSGQKILFVATKKQAKDIVSEVSRKHNMPYITERWLGGLLTNFRTIRKTVKKLNLIDKKNKSGAYESLSKKELLMINRSQKKLEKYIGSISGMTRLPFAIFIIDISREKIALKEAKKLNITTFAMVDTDSNPKLVDYFIPSNDDSSKSISIILKYISEAIAIGISSRQKERENNV